MRRGISTHAPAGGATCRLPTIQPQKDRYFYSRPCGRGDGADGAKTLVPNPFLLTPLREGRPVRDAARRPRNNDFYSRPCGRGDFQQ